jgi:hypothetical protein
MLPGLNPAPAAEKKQPSPAIPNAAYPVSTATTLTQLETAEQFMKSQG